MRARRHGNCYLGISADQVRYFREFGRNDRSLGTAPVDVRMKLLVDLLVIKTTKDRSDTHRREHDRHMQIVVWHAGNDNVIRLDAHIVTQHMPDAVDQRLQFSVGDARARGINDSGFLRIFGARALKPPA